MEMWIIWLIIAAVLVIVEVLSQQVWTLCMAVGCVASMLAALFGLAPMWQIVILAVVAVTAFLVLMPLFRRWHEMADKKSGREGRTGMAALLGRSAVVTEEIKPGSLGRARIDGDYWQVRAPHVAEIIRRGEEVVVTSYDSIILNVQLPHLLQND